MAIGSSKSISPYLALAIAAYAGIALASDSGQQEPYPWHAGASHCTAESESRSCKVEDWPTYRSTRERLMGLARAGQFALLERALAEVAASGDLFPDRGNRAEVVDSTLREILNPGYSETGPDGVLERWRAAFPRSGFIAIADALVLQDAAWAIRGRGHPSLTLPESRELFEARLRQADRVLLVASAAVKETAIWHLIRLRTLCDLQDRGAQVVFEKSVSRWPRYVEFYQAVVHRLTPEWGGNWEAVDSFIDLARRRTALTDGASFYAQIYVQFPGDIASGRTAMQWPKMKKGFADWMQRNPSPFIKNLYAAYACFAGDTGAFREAMRLVDKEIVPSQWLPGHPYAACQRWAEGQGRVEIAPFEPRTMGAL